jgi:hypothetical protein
MHFTSGTSISSCSFASVLISYFTDPFLVAANDRDEPNSTANNDAAKYPVLIPSTSSCSFTSYIATTPDLECADDPYTQMESCGSWGSIGLSVPFCSSPLPLDSCDLPPLITSVPLSPSSYSHSSSSFCYSPPTSPLAPFDFPPPFPLTSSHLPRPLPFGPCSRVVCDESEGMLMLVASSSSSSSFGRFATIGGNRDEYEPFDFGAIVGQHTTDSDDGAETTSTDDTTDSDDSNDGAETTSTDDTTDSDDSNDGTDTTNTDDITSTDNATDTDDTAPTNDSNTTTDTAPSLDIKPKKIKRSMLKKLQRVLRLRI